MEYIIKRKQKIIFSVMALLALLVIALPTIVFAAAVTVSLSPSATSVQQGNTFTVNVNLSTGSATILDAVGRVNFNTSQLQFISASYTPSSAWGSQGPEAGLNGSYYTFDVSTTTNPSGNLSAVQITFKALANSGTSSITLSDVEVGDGDTPPNPNPALHSVSSQNTSVTLTSPPTSPSSPAPSATPTSTPSRTATTTQSNITQTNYSPSSTPAPTTEEQLANANISDEQPVPVTSFFDSTTYPVDITIYDIEGNPVANIPVTLGEQTVNTNDSGTAEFLGLRSGEYTVTADGVEGTVVVAVGEPSAVQTFEFTQSVNNSKKYLLVIIPVIAILGVAGILLYKNRKLLNKQPKSTTVNGMGSTNINQAPSTLENPDVEKYLKTEPPKAETVIHPTNKDNT